MRTDAEVGAMTECDVPTAPRSVQQQLVGLVEHRGIPICRRPQQEQPVAGPELPSGKLRRAPHVAVVPAER